MAQLTIMLAILLADSERMPISDLDIAKTDYLKSIAFSQETRISVQQFDVLIVGKGNAALCAALAARDTGCRVAMLEAASIEESGGNSRFAGGVMRFAYDSVSDLQR